MSLGQPINPVIKQDEVKVHVAPDDVHEVVPANTQRVSVAADHPYRKLGSRSLDACGNGWRPAVNPMKAISIDIIGESTGTTNAGHKHKFLARDAQVWQSFLGLGQNRVITTSGAPAYFLVRNEILAFKLQA